jgi:hypothetical protein
MNRFQYINKNINEIKTEVKIGLMSISILNHYMIYSRYDHYRKRGNGVSLAVLMTSDDFNLSEMTIYTIKKNMESEL